jgi:hypothetical protein
VHDVNSLKPLALLPNTKGSSCMCASAGERPVPCWPQSPRVPSQVSTPLLLPSFPPLLLPLPLHLRKLCAPLAYALRAPRPHLAFLLVAF